MQSSTDGVLLDGTPYPQTPMHVRLQRQTMISGEAVTPGTIVELGPTIARYLITTGKAVAVAAPPSPAPPEPPEPLPGAASPSPSKAPPTAATRPAKR